MLPQVMLSRLPWVTLSVIGLCWVLMLLTTADGEPTSAWWALALDRTATAEVWRLLSGQLLHTSWQHLLLNLAAFGLLAATVEQHSRARLVAGLAAGMAFVAVWFVCQGEFTHYVGLSGALNTLLLIALFGPEHNGHLGRLLRVGLALGILVKNVYEVEQALSMTEIIVASPVLNGWPAAPAAHLAGFGAGLVLLGCEWLERRDATRQRSAPPLALATDGPGPPQ